MNQTNISLHLRKFKHNLLKLYAMKKSIKSIFGVLAIFAVFISSPLQANNSVENEECVTVYTIGDKFAGGWEYTVEGAREGFEKGFMLVVNQNGTYKVQLQLGGGTFMGESVVAKGSKLNFSVDVEGEKVAIALVMKGSKFAGTSTSSKGVFNVMGAKTISAE